MKNIELLNLPEEQKKQVLDRASMLRRHGIDVDIFEVSSGEKPAARIRVAQPRLVSFKVLSQPELINRAKGVFDGIKGVVFHYIPLTHQPDFDAIDLQWISSKMAEYGIRQSDLVKHLGLDKSTVNQQLSGTRNLSRSQKAALYYYFKTYEMAQEFAEQLDMAIEMERTNMTIEKQGNYEKIQ